MLAKPPEALRQTQALLRREAHAEILERMELENGHFAERLQSDEVKQAITAFFAARRAATGSSLEAGDVDPLRAGQVDVGPWKNRKLVGMRESDTSDRM